MSDSLKLLSVNIGISKTIQAKSGRSGIFKQPTNAPVRIERLGLAGDTIVDTKNHGGLDQAVYLYGAPDYAWWENELGRKLAPGLFGENLTVSGLESATIHIGDRFVIGNCVLETTSPRIPCVTFSARMNDLKFAKTFLAAERPGIYCRVLQVGTVSTGDAVTLQPFEGTKVAVNEMLIYKNLPIEKMRRLLQAPIHQKARADYEAKLSS